MRIVALTPFFPAVFHQEIADYGRVLIKEKEFWWPSGTHFFHLEFAGYGPLQGSIQGDHQEIASYGVGYGPLKRSHQGEHYDIAGYGAEFLSRIQSSDKPMRGRNLIMWYEGQWEALKKINRIHTHGHCDQTLKLSEILPEQDCSFPDFTQKCVNDLNFKIGTKQRILSANTIFTTFTSLHNVYLMITTNKNKTQQELQISAWLRWEQCKLDQ